MAKYVVYYETRKGTASSGGTKSHSVECETESAAIQSAKDKAKSQNPGYDFMLKRVEKK